ncbi:MAG: hypothetical protein JWO13_3556 [Acidobacteriales bacterium]|nr:hypothetical protein [Terriglobales bacterium]
MTDSPASISKADLWPELPYSKWQPTCDTLHMWTQMVGKMRLALSPMQNHWWQVPLYVSPHGLTTSSIPYNETFFDEEFDFFDDKLVIRTSTGLERAIGLYPRSVADFYAEYTAAHRELGIDVKIKTMPVEFADPIPFEQDTVHASYDGEYVRRFWRILMNCEEVFQEFRSGFTGKCSPVNFFWGSFDLSVSRYSGRRAPEKKNSNRIEREAYSHEVSSCGFWPGDGRFKEAAFFAYTAPAPSGLDQQRIKPERAFFSQELGEFLLKYDDVRSAENPHRDLLDFCQSTYEAGANLAKWDRDSLERK